VVAKIALAMAAFACETSLGTYVSATEWWSRSDSNQQPECYGRRFESDQLHHAFLISPIGGDRPISPHLADIPGH